MEELKAVFEYIRPIITTGSIVVISGYMICFIIETYYEEKNKKNED